MLEEIIVAAIILIVIYIALTEERSPLYGKFPAIADKLPKGLLDGITSNIKAAMEGFQGDINMVPQPVLSYYKSLPESTSDKIVIGMHFTNWCGYCKQMKPVWQEVKASLKMEGNGGVLMFENDEEASPTQGVDSYPTIIKYQGGKARRYRGRADYDELRKFILTPFTVTTFGSMLPS